MMRKDGSKLSGILFILAGGAFILAAITGRQWAFGGIAITFIAIGVNYLISAKNG